MNLFQTLVVLISLTLVGGCAHTNSVSDNQSIESEVAKFEGNWVAVEIEVGGKKTKIAQSEDQVIRYQGKSFSVTSKKGELLINGTFTVNPDVTPKTMDLHYAANTPSKELADKGALAIYRMRGDEFTACFTANGVVRPRPSEFKTAPNDNLVIYTYKRKK